MRLPAISPWIFRLWVALVLFSQTALASRLADAFMGLFLAPGPAVDSWMRFVTQKTYHVLLFSSMGAPARPALQAGGAGGNSRLVR
ncbi:MAG: hypothetical protein R2748_00065 [Bryobacterales bacterium]